MVPYVCTCVHRQRWPPNAAPLRSLFHRCLEVSLVAADDWVQAAHALGHITAAMSTSGDLPNFQQLALWFQPVPFDTLAVSEAKARKCPPCSCLAGATRCMSRRPQRGCVAVFLPCPRWRRALFCMNASPWNVVLHR